MDHKAIYNRHLSSQLRSEIATLIRFTTVGLLATIVHIGVAAIILFYINEALFLANFIAFIVALNVSFFGHRFFSFKRNGIFGRFFIIALSGFAYNNIILSGLVYFKITGGVVAITFSTLCVPLIIYLLSRFWVFTTK